MRGCLSADTFRFATEYNLKQIFHNYREKEKIANSSVSRLTLQSVHLENVLHLYSSNYNECSLDPQDLTLNDGDPLSPKVWGFANMNVSINRSHDGRRPTETESESPTTCAHYSLVLDVLEPKPVGLPDPNELIHNDGGEQFSGAVPGLEHAANVQVDVVHGAVSLLHLLR